MRTGGEDPEGHALGIGTKLDLDSFCTRESLAAPHAHVLNSPRSLRACHNLGIRCADAARAHVGDGGGRGFTGPRRPCELLPRSMAALEEEGGGALSPFELQLLYESGEKRRLALLHAARAERAHLIAALEGGRRPHRPAWPAAAVRAAVSAPVDAAAAAAAAARIGGLDRATRALWTAAARLDPQGPGGRAALADARRRGEERGRAARDAAAGRAAEVALAQRAAEAALAQRSAAASTASEQAAERRADKLLRAGRAAAAHRQDVRATAAVRREKVVESARAASEAAAASRGRVAVQQRRAAREVRSALAAAHAAECAAHAVRRAAREHREMLLTAERRGAAEVKKAKAAWAAASTSLAANAARQRALAEAAARDDGRCSTWAPRALSGPGRRHEPSSAGLA